MHGLKQAGEGRLADSDDPFDGNIHGSAPMVKSRSAAPLARDLRMAPAKRSAH